MLFGVSWPLNLVVVSGYCAHGRVNARVDTWVSAVRYLLAIVSSLGSPNSGQILCHPCYTHWCDVSFAELFCLQAVIALGALPTINNITQELCFQPNAHAHSQPSHHPFTTFQSSGAAAICRACSTSLGAHRATPRSQTWRNVACGVPSARSTWWRWAFLQLSTHVLRCDCHWGGDAEGLSLYSNIRVL